jgi:hypothetical protein
MANAMPGFTAESAMTSAQPYAMVQTATESSRGAWVYPQANVMSQAGARLSQAEGGGASCRCPCCIISGGILWCC